MFKDTYREALEQLTPDAAQMERLFGRLETAGRRGKRPTLREVLAGALGSFGPYSQTVEGTTATDQGIEISVVSAVVDRNLGRIYLAVQDKTGDRLGGERLHISVGAERTGEQAERWNINVLKMILSPMSISVFSELNENAAGSRVLPIQLAVFLSDGRMVRGRSGGGVNHGGQTSDGPWRHSWAFDEAVDAEQVVGVAFGMWYVPVDGDAVGPGHWLEKLPE